MTKVLNIVGIKRSTYYYQKNGKVTVKQVSEGRPAPGYSQKTNGTKIPDDQIKEWLMELVEGDGYAYGYRKLAKTLRRQEDLILNKKKAYRLCKELGILRPQRQRVQKTPRVRAKNRTLTRSNQLWETDVKYGYITGEDRFFFVLSYIDVFDRSIIDYHIGLECTAKQAAQTLQQALFKRQLFDGNQEMPAIRSDNGPQFTSLTYRVACDEFGVEHERIPPKTPNANAHIESFHRLLEDDCFSREEFEIYAHAYEWVAWFMQFYNERRLHGSIQDLAPNEFYQAHQKGEITQQAVTV